MRTRRIDPLRIERNVQLIKSNSFALVCMIGISLTANSFTFGQVSKGYAPVNGIRMYYEIYDTAGIPLVLIHGGGSTIESNFGFILPMLAGKGRVIALELQAHGRTSDRNTGVSFEQDADDVASLLAYLKIDKANFFGFSNGGNTAMQVAIRHPNLVNKLVIASSFYKREGILPGLFENLEKGSLSDMPAQLQSAFLKVTPDKSKLQAMFDKDKNRMLQFKNWSDDALRSITFPTLLIQGDHDVITIEHILEMSRIIPHARVMILPGTHGSYIGEMCTAEKDSKIPALVVDVIDEFLKNNNYQ